MKLNNSDRDAFVHAVMKDVPEVDYQEQVNKLVIAAAVAKLPPKVRAIWNDGELRGFVKTDKCYRIPGYRLCNVMVPDTNFETPELATQVEVIACKAQEQKNLRQELRQKVNGLIYGCTTLKQATERLPEFVKYLPQDRDGTGVINLPAVSNVVADLAKAGWPKDAKKPAARAKKAA